MIGIAATAGEPNFRRMFFDLQVIYGRSRRRELILPRQTISHRKPK